VCVCTCAAIFLRNNLIAFQYLYREPISLTARVNPARHSSRDAKKPAYNFACTIGGGGGGGVGGGEFMAILADTEDTECIADRPLKITASLCAR